MSLRVFDELASNRRASMILTAFFFKEADCFHLDVRSSKDIVTCSRKIDLVKLEPSRSPVISPLSVPQLPMQLTSLSGGRSFIRDRVTPLKERGNAMAGNRTEVKKQLQIVDEWTRQRLGKNNPNKKRFMRKTDDKSIDGVLSTGIDPLPPQSSTTVVIRRIYGDTLQRRPDKWEPFIGDHRLPFTRCCWSQPFYSCLRIAALATYGMMLKKPGNASFIAQAMLSHGSFATLHSSFRVIRRKS
ncbi:unnamed protein product [Soboliphyme baturini]|uniref:Uncharacterized protein n=1 Tax=Soboliphyme baturini TaxID=241478 RepID=A0A183ICC2_9BILA|nr:unnamed protein product [Soboliphyme baturini]